MSQKNKPKKQKFFVQGMHCSSCELLIEKKLSETADIKKAEASLRKGEVDVTYTGTDNLSANDLNNLFKDLGYKFSLRKIKNGGGKLNILQPLVVVFLILAGFFLLQRSGIGNVVSVSSFSTPPTFFLFGLVAGISTCAALIGGLLLSLSQKWNEVYIGEDTKHRAVPFVMFNLGRLISFALLGGILGAIGSLFHMSLTFTSLLTISVAILMLVLGLQMVGVPWANKIQFKAPKSITTKISDEGRFKGKYMPFTIGALTFFLPCGFTILAQSASLASGNFITGSLMMSAFALGTLPTLALISFTSVELTKKPKLTASFNYVAGLLVIFFALYNFNSQLNVMGWKSINDLPGLFKTDPAPTTRQLSDVQLMQMEATAYGYYPTKFALQSGVPVRWEIYDSGTTGCTNAIIARGLIDGSIRLSPGLNVYEFTPQKPGVYKATCWMGMAPPVTIEVY
jgi:uncharacterized protein